MRSYFAAVFKHIMRFPGFHPHSFRKAFTLIEVIIAGLLLSMMAIVCGGIILSTCGTFNLDKNKYLAAQEASSLNEELKNYVTGDLSVTLNAPGKPAWHLVDDTSCKDCWALAVGTHDVSGRLQDSMRQDYNASMSYTVTVAQYQGRSMRDVQINVKWDDAK